jgi:hypothetical protein
MNTPLKATRTFKQTLKFQRILFLPEKIKLLLKGGGSFPNSMMGGGVLWGGLRENN